MNDEGFKRLCQHDLGCFIYFAFKELYPHEEYHHNWHIDLIQDYLTRVSRGEINRLIISMPPRMLKSFCVSVAWPAWLMGRDPSKKILCLHGSKRLGNELEDLCFSLTQQKRFKALFPNCAIKQDGKGIHTSFGGKRQFMPMMGSIAGLGANIIIIDDPINTQDIRKKSLRKALCRQFDENVLQRLNDKKIGGIVIVSQRIHEDDLTGYIIKHKNGWVHLNLSAIALQDERYELSDGRIFTRKKGEVLHSERESFEQLLTTLDQINGYAFAYQYLQGQLMPKFRDKGHGCIWSTPFKHGEFYDTRIHGAGNTGFKRITEKDLILSRVFGIGEDPCPANMRGGMTPEEWMIVAEIARDRYMRNMKETAEL